MREVDGGGLQCGGNSVLIKKIHEEGGGGGRGPLTVVERQHGHGDITETRLIRGTIYLSTLDHQVLIRCVMSMSTPNHTV